VSKVYANQFLNYRLRLSDYKLN